MARASSVSLAEKAGQGPAAVMFSRAGEQNVLRRKGTVDEVLESLHRILAHQANEPHATPLPVSFVSAPKTAKPRSTTSERKSRPRTLKPGTNNVRVAKVRSGLADAECLVDLAGKLGADVSHAAERLDYAKRAVRKGELGKAGYSLNKASASLRDAILSEYELKHRSVSQRINRTARAGGNISGAKRALFESKRKARARELGEAVAQLFESEKKLGDSQAELVLRILYDSKGKFMIANKAGLNIGPAVELVNDSRRKLREGQIEEAVVLAKRGVEAINTILGTHEKAKSMLLMCNRAIGAAESVGADVESARKRLGNVMEHFKAGKYDLCVHDSRKTVADMKRAARDRAAEAAELAERAASLARDSGLSTPDSEDYIAMAKDALAKDEFAKCIELSSLSMYRSNSMLAAEIGKKVRNIDRFARDITGELSNVTEVEKAIAASKERCLETVRKYASMTEELVGQAYDSAVSYTRVTQDVVKQACQDFFGPEGVSSEQLPKEMEITSSESQGSSVAPAVRNDSQRLRIVDLYLRGRITDVELDRLLLMLDSGQDRAELV